MANTRKTASPVDPTDALCSALTSALTSALPDGACAQPEFAGASRLPRSQGTQRRHRVGIAFSGGVDSTVLLHLAVRVLGAGRCIAIHVHHGLQAQADSWLTHCAHVCTTLAVPFVGERVQLASDTRTLGIEAAARLARYDALTAVAQRHEIGTILLAHHADDQAETVLLQMLRGTGLAGLSAMPQRQRRWSLADGRADRSGAAHDCPDPDGSRGVSRVSGTPDVPDRHVPVTWLRPLLDVPRSVVAAYADRHGLTWIDDPSNADARYKRNALRHHVMPALDAHFPGLRTTLGRVARHAAEAQTLLDEVAAEDWLRCRSPSAPWLSDDTAPPDAAMVLDLLAYHSLRTAGALSTARQANILRFWVRRSGARAMSEARFATFRGTVERCADDAILAANAAAGKTDRSARVMIHDGNALHRRGPLLYWVSGATCDAPAPARRRREPAQLRYVDQTAWVLPQWGGAFRFSTTAPVTSAAGSRIGADVLTSGLVLSMGVWPVSVAVLRGTTLRAVARSGGERLKLAENRPHRSLKQLFQEAAVPVVARDVPLLYLDETLCFVPHVGGCLDTAVQNGELPLRYVYWQPDRITSDDT